MNWLLLTFFIIGVVIAYWVIARSLSNRVQSEPVGPLVQPDQPAHPLDSSVDLNPLAKQLERLGAGYLELFCESDGACLLIEKGPEHLPRIVPLSATGGVLALCRVGLSVYVIEQTLDEGESLLVSRGYTKSPSSRLSCEAVEKGLPDIIALLERCPEAPWESWERFGDHPLDA